MVCKYKLAQNIFRRQRKAPETQLDFAVQRELLQSVF